MKYTIHNDDNIQALKQYPDNHFDSIVTDPPYGIEFLGKEWDKNTGAVETWQECLRVLKPGGYLLAFSAARTYHQLATNIEQVGFEIRDQLMWLYASGFPKAQDIGKAIQRRQGVEEEYTIEEWEAKQGYSVNRPGETMGFGDPKNRDGHGDAGLSGKIAKCTSPQAQQWEGWKTALKPAHEPIVMARKPFKGSTIDNVLEHGTGALNIDASRLSFAEDDDPNATFAGGGTNWTDAIGQEDTEARATLGDRKAFSSEHGRYPNNVIGEVEGYQKYFYCPKVGRKERHIGLEMPPALFGDKQGAYDDNGQRYAVELDKRNLGNHHPTVKPVALMKYLVQLVTPKGGIVLDPFTGSGATGMAAVELGNEFIGCELDPNYVSIAETRIEAWYESNKPDNNFDELFKDNT